MRFNECRDCLRIVSATLLVVAMVQGCGEKKIAPSSTATSGAGTGSTASGSASGTGSETAATFDVCKEAKLKLTSTLLSRVCTDVASLRANAFDGTAHKVNPTVGGSGKQLTVDLTASALVNAAVNDYYKMMRMQINNSAAFKAAAFQFDPNARLEDRAGTDDAPTYRYVNEADDGAVSYRAKSSFLTIKDGVSYAQITDQIDASDVMVTERMTKLQGLIIIEKKDDTHTWVYTTTLQEYTENGGTNAVATLKDRIKKSLVKEQEYSFANASQAKEKAQ